MLLKQEVNKLHTFRKRETYKSLEGPFPKMWKQKRVTGEDTLTSNATKKRLSYTWGWLQGMQRTPGFCSSHESFYHSKFSGWHFCDASTSEFTMLLK